MSGLRQTPLTCSGHTRPVVSLAFSELTPHGYFLISACKDGKPMLRQGDTGDWIGTFEGHKGAVWDATLTKDATKAATGAADFTAKVWDAVCGAELKSFLHKHIVKCVDFSSDNTKLLTASNEKLIKLFDLAQPESEPTVFSGHTNNMRGALITKDNKRIISASDDKTVRAWDVVSGEEVRKLEFVSAPSSLELARDGTVLVITYGPFTSFWKADTFEKIAEYESPTDINTASLHSTEDVFVCGGEDFKMYKMDYNTGVELESFKGHFGPVHCVRFSPDGELYASGSEDGTLRLWQTNVGNTYGLWKCIMPDEGGLTNDTQAVTVKAEA